MAELSSNEIKKMQKSVAKEFPYDFALQQVHLSRRIITAKAKKEGLNTLAYIIKQRKS